MAFFFADADEEAEEEGRLRVEGEARDEVDEVEGEAFEEVEEEAGAEGGGGAEDPGKANC